MSQAIDTLLRAWSDHGPADPGRAVLLGARVHPDLEVLGDACLVQSHRAFAKPLIDAGHEVLPFEDGVEPADHVLVLPDRQQQRARSEIARAIRLVKPGGTVWCCAPTREGGKRHVGTFKRLLGEVGQDSRAHCRVVWAEASGPVDAAALDEMAAEGAVQVVDGWRTRPGLFSWDRPDPGSQMLADLLPLRLAGRAVDLGAGWGWLTNALLERCDKVETVDAVEADGHAVAVGRDNLEARFPGRVTWHWADVVTERPVTRAQVVVSNPPFHVGGTARTGLGRAFLEQGAKMLHPEGELWAVANRQLAYEETLEKVFARHRIVKEVGRYKVFHAWAPRR